MIIYIGYQDFYNDRVENVKNYLDSINIHYHLINNDNDIFKTSLEIAEKVAENPNLNRGIIIDDFGTLPFMVTAKQPFIIAAQLNDEHSAKMTRDHNNANVICLGAEVIGSKVMLGITKRFVEHDYAGGRHQIRVDMLNEMRDE